LGKPSRVGQMGENDLEVAAVLIIQKRTVQQPLSACAIGKGLGRTGFNYGTDKANGIRYTALCRKP
jgi:hypothetical protein